MTRQTERQTRAYGRLLTSAQALTAYATLILVIALIDVVTRTLDPITKVKLGTWMLGAFVLTMRIVRVLKRIDERGQEWGDAEKLLFQVAALIPVAGIIPLVFL